MWPSEQSWLLLQLLWSVAPFSRRGCPMLLFREIQKASISHYISFSNDKLAPVDVRMLVREARSVGYINLGMLNHWKELMREHNRILARGHKLGLLGGIITVKSKMIPSLDMYMLQIQSKYLAEILDDFTSFGKRVVKSISESPAGMIWALSGAVTIEINSWVRFCQQMMSLIQTIGVDCPENKAHLHPWPDRELLEASVARARRTFAPFAAARPGAPEIPSPLPRRDDGGHDAEEPRGRRAAPEPQAGGKRRRRALGPSAASALPIAPAGDEVPRRPALPSSDHH